MRPEDHKVLVAYIRDVANRLNLRDWAFTLRAEPPEDGQALGMVAPIEGRKCASIYLCDNFRELLAEDQRHTIVHELLHCHMVAATDIVRLDLWEQRALSQSSYNLLFGGFRRQVEYAVDGITDAIASFYPLIEWGEDNPTGTHAEK